MIWLLIQLTTFTVPGANITAREIYIPFETASACEAARAGILSSPVRQIGIAADSAACVTPQDDGEFRKTTEAWPSGRTWGEEKDLETARRQNAKARIMTCAELEKDSDPNRHCYPASK